MKLHRKVVVGLTILTFLAGAGQACRAEQAKASGEQSAVAELLRLLQAKGVISKEEANELEKKFDRGSVDAAGAAKGEATAVPGEQQAGKTLAPFAFEESMETIEALNDQGIISDAEMDELKGRANTLNRRSQGEAVAEEKRRLVGMSDIQYRRTTIEADEVQDSLKFLSHQDVISREEAAKAFERFRKKYPTDQMAENISDELAWDMRYQLDQKMQTVAELEKKNAKLPEWLDRFTLSGDLRLRYEGDFFDSDNGDFLNPSNPTVLLNSHSNQSLFRLRARLGILAKVTDGVEAGLRLATGTTSNPVSTNVTLGDFFNKKSIELDLAYLKWNPAAALTLWGGRFPNPWFFTEMVWDQDLNFDGFAAQYKPVLSESWGLFLTAGAFPLQFVDQHQKWLFGGQAGANYKYGNKLTAKLGVAFYDFENTVGVRNGVDQPAGSTDWSAPLFQQKGNTVFYIDPTNSSKLGYASAYQELNITGSLDLAFWDPVHVVFTGDYVNNLGYNLQDVLARVMPPNPQDVKKETEGFQLGVTVGHPVVQAFADWKAWLNYRYLESDAVIDAFTDSDFHLGGTNAKGWILGAELGLTKNVWLTSRWLTANEISGPPFGIDVFQFDLNAKF